MNKFIFNLSKKGINVHWGNPVYNNLEENKTSSHKYPRANSMERYNLEHQSFTPVVNGKIDTLSSPEHQAFVDSIKSILTKNFITKTVSIFFILISFIICICLELQQVLIVGITITVIVLCLFLTLFLNSRRYIVIDYNIDENISNIINDRSKAFSLLNNSSVIWYISEYHDVTYSRVNAGCSTNITRHKTNISLQHLPSYIITPNNDKFYQMSIGTTKYIFLPDKILVIDFLSVATLKYSDINIKLQNTNFVETDIPPRDSEFLYNTWQYANNDGSRDLRFNNNKQLPVYKYKTIILKSESGLNIHLIVSNHKAAEEFKSQFNSVKEIF